MTKMLKWGWLVLVIGLVLLGIGIRMNGAQNITFDNWQPKISRSKLITKKYTDISSFNTIDVRTSETGVKLVKGDKYAVEYTGRDRYKPSVSTEHQRLIIKQSEGKFNAVNLGFNYNGDSEDTDQITITVPQDISLKTVKVRSDSGMIALDNQKAATLKLTVADGDIKLANVTASNVQLASQDGEITANQTNLSSGTISQNDGDLTMKKGEIKQLKIQNQDGDVNYAEMRLNDGSLKMQDGDFEAEQISVIGTYSVNNNDGDNTVRDAQVGGYHLITSDGTNYLYDRNSNNDLVWNSKTTDILKLITTDGDNKVK
ncbi:DUF4097 family beta strand repeat-containing protein [Liquorilactobacillus capillatus]|uniref:DUF4097 domain-containing protein n=1 Tax=Liquorilactobacillus capillatus DSM 19910 TaxID=1423731 RepID=A0A0R1M5X0_9LACO|nr:DUF4097 family beta strand repeat-containing protein [Liquorilactobacillus capillatus]KRL03565.1 hypothetical protein FC81_GL001819 [Liquorilactobacillus capillatus DSM 19910]